MDNLKLFPIKVEALAGTPYANGECNFEIIHFFGEHGSFILILYIIYDFFNDEFKP